MERRKTINLELKDIRTFLGTLNSHKGNFHKDLNMYVISSQSVLPVLGPSTQECAP